MATPGIEHRQLESRPPDLIEVFIILLISAAAIIFIFWISTQYLGSDEFKNLPGWIVAVFSNIWTAVGTGATGVGLALVKALSTRGKPQPNYLKYVGLCVAGLLVPIALLITITQVSSDHGPVATQPPNTVTIDRNKIDKTDFDLEVPFGFPTPLKYTLRGSFRVQDGAVIGHLDSGKVAVSQFLPEGFPHMINRISFRACYIDSRDPRQPRNIFPVTPKTRDSVDTSLQIKPDASYSIPSADFGFDLPPAAHIRAMWLCAALQTETGMFPAE